MNKTPENTDFPVVEADDEGMRLDRWLRRRFPALTQGQIQKWLRTKQIRVDGKKADSAHHLKEGEQIRVPPFLMQDPSFSEKPTQKRGKPVRNPEKIKEWILFEDKDVVIINKPAGLAVQGGTGLKENLDDSLMALSVDGETRPKLVHRLDRETSGVLLIARNDFAARKLAASFRARETQKIYWAITRGAPRIEAGLIEAPLMKKGQIMCVPKPKDDPARAKSAATLYKIVEQLERRMTFMALWPLTGRTHQLRAHMAHIGTPILGDPLYGHHQAQEVDLPKGDTGAGLHLHARRLIIPHPRSGMIDVVAPLGPEMRKTWQWLHFDEEADISFDEE